jgi:predicted double-glycine peptidase
MRYLHDDPTAHWFVVTGFDADNVYVNDPWVLLRKGKTARDMTNAAIPRRLFDKVTSYGTRRERALVLLGR